MTILNVINKLIFNIHFTDFLILIALSFLAYVFQFYYKYFTRPNKLPGPLPLPFIECTYMFTSDIRQLFMSLQKKYGDICEIYLNGFRRIIISRPEYLEKMLAPSSKDTTFMLRLPNSGGFNELGMSESGIAVNHIAKNWKFNRQFFNQTILSSSINYEIVEWGNKLFPELEGYWKSLVNLNLSDDNLQNINWILEVNLATWIRNFTNEMVVVLLTGERSYAMASYYNILSPVKVSRSSTLIEDPERFIQGFANHLMGLTLFMYLGPFFRHYVPFYKNKIKILFENRDYLYGVLDMIIKKRRKEIEKTPVDVKLRHDMLTFLITANTERDIKSVKDDMPRPLTDAEIRSNLFDAFAGASDTISTSFSIISYYLCHYPQVKEKMLAEIDSVFPQNTPFNLKYEDLLKLEYCDAVINEVGRIRPTGNEFPRYVENPCEVAGYLWDAGTMFHVNTNGIHSHKDHWPNPEIFDPNRFYKKDPSPKHKFSLVTFGGGLRSCPGRKIASIELISLLVLVFRKYDIELVDMNAPVVTKSMIANSCEELEVRIRPRN